MTFTFNTRREYTRMHVWCKFGDSSPKLWQVIALTSQISKNSESKWPKWTWRPNSMTSIFNTSREYPRMHVWCKFGDSSPNLWQVIALTNQISKNSESKWPKWTWRPNSMTSIFNTSREYPRMHVWCKFGDSSPNLWQVIALTSQISKNSESKWPKWTWRPNSMTSIFNTSREYPRMHVWCKFGDSSPNLWRVIAQTRKRLRTDRRTDRRTDAGNDNTPSAWKAKGWKRMSITWTFSVTRKF